MVCDDPCRRYPCGHDDHLVELAGSVVMGTSQRDRLLCNFGYYVNGPPPPSYEEAVQGTGGTSMDTDDMEPFVPRYPFYPRLTDIASEKRRIDDTCTA
ncbi:unnamed protein product [Haemonchus placei]|uniref:Uncharacterized protein n=1 Tax=Haemonchus placei TaxID=6290 RepID=A0A0N4X549_HAEPC|nr:unnamed protein product [Haemonchus placei]